MPDRDSVINDLVERIEATLAVDSEWVNMPLDLVQYTLHLLKEDEYELNSLGKSLNETVEFNRKLMKKITERAVKCDA